MNYSAHYDRLINRARCRALEGYRERHHVLPMCMGGGNEPLNLVELTAEEHYVAHQLLAKMHPAVPGLVWSALRLARGCYGHKAYGWLRRLHSIESTGKTPSLETRAKLSAARRGRVTSPVTRERLSAARRGKKFSPEHCANISAGLKGRGTTGRTLTPEHRVKISVGNKGKKRSAESRIRLSAAQRKRHQDDPASYLKKSLYVVAVA